MLLENYKPTLDFFASNLDADKQVLEVTTSLGILCILRETHGPYTQCFHIKAQLDAFRSRVLGAIEVCEIAIRVF